MRSIRLEKVKKSERGEYEIVSLFIGAKAVEVDSFWMDLAYPWHLLEANEYLLEKMGAKPAHAVHIGDSLEDDIKGAGRAGIWGIWIDRHGRKGSMPVPHPFNHVPAIGHLGELI